MPADSRETTFLIGWLGQSAAMPQMANYQMAKYWGTAALCPSHPPPFNQRETELKHGDH